MVVRARWTELRISLAVLCQMNGVGLLFQCSIQVSSASLRCFTDLNAVLVRRLRVRTENQHSTRFSHEVEVGVK